MIEGILTQLCPWCGLPFGDHELEELAECTLDALASIDAEQESLFLAFSEMRCQRPVEDVHVSPALL